MEFSRFHSPIDLFENDIVLGELKTYNGATEGILYRCSDSESNKHNDPILE